MGRSCWLQRGLLHLSNSSSKRQFRPHSQEALLCRRNSRGHELLVLFLKVVEVGEYFCEISRCHSLRGRVAGGRVRGSEQAVNGTDVTLLFTFVLVLVAVLFSSAALAFSPDGQWLAVGDMQYGGGKALGKIKLWRTSEIM